MVQINILDARTSDLKRDGGHAPLTGFIKDGSPVVPTGLRLPIEDLPPGQYKVELRAVDSTGSFAIRTADFEIL
jgi:hypothetical protein